jgi:dihydrofolate synthase / folylpolyglutamate synthase
MDYPEVIKYLYEQLPMFQRIGPSAFKKDLHNTIALCQALGNPHKKFKSIHVAGTNGKGSSSHMLAACFQSAGYKTGLYTSPHLKEFTERIKINGKEMAKDEVVEFVLKNKWLIEEIKPSFFEMTVAMAFDQFARHAVDIAIIEVGLGGRLDSTNIIEPLISLITNISFDHQSLLGNTLEEIAFEKAGIIKRNTPVVISQTQNEVKDVFIKKAAEESAPISFAGNELHVYKNDLATSKMVADVLRHGHPAYELLELGLSGEYQLKNIAGVLTTLEIANQLGFSISEAALREGIANVVELTGLKGRWQKLRERPLIVCDTAHNEDGIQEVIKQIKNTPHKDLFIVFGTVNDKDVSKILVHLPVHATYFFCEANIPRALKAEELYKSAEEFHLKGEIIKDVNEAIARAKSLAKQEDLIFVGGSNFVVAEIENL